MKGSVFPKVSRSHTETLQVNIGYKCNQKCVHCHVNAGPDRWEMMDEKTVRLVPILLDKYKIGKLDLTGGAPEMHPHFKYLVKAAREIDVEVIDRCNLTILNEPGFEDMAYFLASNKVTVIASLPCYDSKNVDKQRGNGVFERSIYGLKQLNSYGYGFDNNELILNLVYNPLGPSLPPSQEELEASYKEELYKRYNIKFNNLYTLANMPINRFANDLRKKGKLEVYQSLLIDSHNNENLDKIMCKNTISVNWEGKLFDCDFNQQLGICMQGEYTINDLINNNNSLDGNAIKVGNHCFGCTAGSGSSCGGALS